MSYLGDDAATPNVTGRGTHTSWAGLGVTGAGYAATYEAARRDAVREAQSQGGEPGFLYNIKVFRENRSWPQILSAGLVGVGALAALEGSPEIMAVMWLGAGVLFPLEQYDIWIVADYTEAPTPETD